MQSAQPSHSLSFIATPPPAVTSAQGKPPKPSPRPLPLLRWRRLLAWFGSLRRRLLERGLERLLQRGFWDAQLEHQPDDGGRRSLGPELLVQPHDRRLVGLLSPSSL